MAELRPILSGPRGTGYIYFLLARDGLARPMVKIGFSVRSPDGRLKDCQTGSPVRLELLATITGVAMADERDLHRRFKDSRSHGEWFYFDGELQSYIEGLPN